MLHVALLAGLLAVFVACGDDSGAHDAAAPAGDAAGSGAGCGADCVDGGSGAARCPRHADAAACAADPECHALTGYELDAADSCMRKDYIGCAWNQSGCGAAVTVLKRAGVCWLIPGCVPSDWQGLPQGDCTYPEFDYVGMCGAGELDAGSDEDAAVGTGAGIERPDCDVRKAACLVSTPTCDEGLVPSVAGLCYGPCVPIESCGCDEAADCPDADHYTCHLSAGHCGPYVN